MDCGTPKNSGPPTNRRSLPVKNDSSLKSGGVINARWGYHSKICNQGYCHSNFCSSVLGFLMNIHAFLYENLVIKSMRSAFASAAVSFSHTDALLDHTIVYIHLKHPRDWDNRFYAHPATDIALATYSVTVWGQYPTANWRFCLDIRPILVEHRGGVHLPSSTFASASCTFM